MIMQGGLTLTTGKTYILSFKVKADSARTLTVIAGQSEDPYTAYGETIFNITTSETEYTFEFTMNSLTDTAAQLEFDLGKNSANVYIDDVSLTEK